MKRLLLIGFTVGIFAAPIAAQAADSLVFTRTFVQRTDLVEQQSIPHGWPDSGQEFWVYNPMLPTCDWDIDDWQRWEASGTLTKNTSSIVSVCIVADDTRYSDPVTGQQGFNHRISITIGAANNNMMVTLSNDHGETWVVPATKSGNGYLWKTCIFDMTGYPNPLSWFPEIPDSNGGRGIASTYTLTLAGGVRDTRQVSARFVAGSEGNTHWGCP